MKNWPLAIRDESGLIAWIDFKGYYHVGRGKRKAAVNQLLAYSKAFVALLPNTPTHD